MLPFHFPSYKMRLISGDGVDVMMISFTPIIIIWLVIAFVSSSN